MGHSGWEWLLNKTFVLAERAKRLPTYWDKHSSEPEWWPEGDSCGKEQHRQSIAISNVWILQQ
ncbi:hypothetical protein ABIF90_007263 [Bradyrhizobium japonicum]